MAASMASHSTQGGCSFDELCRGTQVNYVTDKSCLVDLTPHTNLINAENALLDHLERCLQDIEIQRGAPIAQLYIGKTYSQAKSGTKFDNMNPNTWRKGGIGDRFRDHKEKDYGKDGLFVITAITKECLPEGTPANQKEVYALSLESRLIQQLYFNPRFNKYKYKLANPPPTMPGKTGDGSYVAYPLYVAFTMGKVEEVEEKEEKEEKGEKG